MLRSSAVWRQDCWEAVSWRAILGCGIELEGTHWLGSQDSHLLMANGWQRQVRQMPLTKNPKQQCLRTPIHTEDSIPTDINFFREFSHRHTSEETQPTPIQVFTHSNPTSEFVYLPKTGRMNHELEITLAHTLPIRLPKAQQSLGGLGE